MLTLPRCEGDQEVINTGSILFDAAAAGTAKHSCLAAVCFLLQLLGCRLKSTRHAWARAARVADVAHALVRTVDMRARLSRSAGSAHHIRRLIACCGRYTNR